MLFPIQNFVSVVVRGFWMQTVRRRFRFSSDGWMLALQTTRFVEKQWLVAF